MKTLKLSIIHTLKGDSTPVEQGRTFIVIAIIVTPIVIAFFHHVTLA